jgi:hypothetical protein
MHTDFDWATIAQWGFVYALVIFLLIRVIGSWDQRERRKKALDELRDMRHTHLAWALVLSEDGWREKVEAAGGLDFVVGTPEYHNDRAFVLECAINSFGAAA